MGFRQSGILVLRLSALGDVIHTIPAVVALRSQGAEVAWVVERPYRELVEIVAEVRAIPVSMKRWGGSLFASRAEIRATLRAMRGFGASVDFQSLVKSAALAWVALTPARFGFERAAIRERPALLFTNRRIAVDTTRHVVEWNLELAGGVAGRPLPMPAVDFSRFPDGPGFEHAIVLLPGAGRANKQWPVERFRELARRIGERALTAWGPGEEELALGVSARLAPPTNLRQLASVLQAADLVIGGDTGPLHLAAALGTKVIGLYGPTSEKRNGPYGQLQHCISTFEGAKTMEAIEVDDVMRKMVEVLGP
jgi:lipopolysaccharide heptosyltransferase I